MLGAFIMIGSSRGLLGGTGERLTRASYWGRHHDFAWGKPAVIDILVDLHELSPMSFYRILPSGRPL